MKNKWKKFLCALALIPCTAFMAACSETPSNDTTPPTEQGSGSSSSGGTSGGSSGGSSNTAALTEDQMYAKVHTLSSAHVNEQTKTVSMKGDTFEVFTLTGKIQKSADGVTFEDANSHVAGFITDILGEMLSGYRYQQEVGYNLETGEGYEESYYKDAPSVVDGVYLDADAVRTAIGDISKTDDVNSLEYTVIDNSRLVHYDIDGETVEGSYVGKDYVHTKQCAEIQENLGILHNIAKYNTLANFKEYVVGYANEALSRSEADITLTNENSNITVSVAKSSDNYVLTCTMTTKAPVASADGSYDY